MVPTRVRGIVRVERDDRGRPCHGARRCAGARPDAFAERLRSAHRALPSLPSQNSTLRAALTANKTYLDRLFEVSDKLGAWITEAQRQGELDATLPPEVVLYTLFARACDPVLGFLKAGGQHSDEQIIEWVLATCFNGLRGA